MTLAANITAMQCLVVRTEETSPGHTGSGRLRTQRDLEAQHGRRIRHIRGFLGLGAH